MPPGGTKPGPPEPPEPPGNDLLRDLVGYWKFDAVSGPEPSAIGDLEFEAVNNPGSANGIIVRSRTFSGTPFPGSAEYLRREAPPAGVLATGPVSYTLQAWVYLTTKATGANQAIWSRYDYDGITYFPEYVLLYDVAADQFAMNWYYEPGSNVIRVMASNFGSPPLNTWCLIHFWVDYPALQLGISVNAGTPNFATAIPTPIARQNTETLWGILYSRGSSPTTIVWRLAGRLDEFAFWKGRVLTQADRSMLWNDGDGLPFEAFERNELKRSRRK